MTKPPYTRITISFDFKGNDDHCRALSGGLLVWIEKAVEKVNSMLSPLIKSRIVHWEISDVTRIRK